MQAIRVKPIYLESIWAGDRLKKIRRFEADRIGISREVCAYRNSENPVLNPEYEGMTLRQLIDTYPQELMGSLKDDQMIRVALMDTKEDLSIQVHPDEAYARQNNDFAKNESWYVVDCDPGASLIAGTTTEDKEALREAASTGKMDRYLKRIDVEPGDFVMVPANMLHACGKNMLVIEIGSFGGITYRIYDYGRPRPLDLERSFEILQPELKTEKLRFPLENRKQNSKRTAVIHSEFSVYVLDIADEMALPEIDRYRVLSCVDGEATVITDEGSTKIGYLDSLILPASSKNIKIVGNARILLSLRTPNQL